MNKCSGVVGAFNCQGAGWCKVEKKTSIHDESPGTLTGSVRADDVDLITQVAGPNWNGEAVVYAHRSGEVFRLPKGASLPVTLKEITANISFAAIGLLDMFNTGGTVKQFEVQMVSAEKPELFDGEVHSELSSLLSDIRSPIATVVIQVRGYGRFSAYSSQRPLKCSAGNTETEFNYDSTTGLLTLTVPVAEKEMYEWPIEIQL